MNDINNDIKMNSDDHDFMTEKKQLNILKKYVKNLLSLIQKNKA